MKQNLINTMTASELAGLFGVQKQTILYYDKIGILKPEYISTNGYRHYTLRQYMTLEIIINLRKMNIPMSEIKEYLEHRDVEGLESILEKKLLECDEFIAQKKRIKKDIIVTLSQICKIRETLLNQFSLSFRPKKTFFLSDVKNIPENIERFKIFTKHNNIVFSKQHFKEKAIGWIVPARDFLAGKQPRPIAFFSPIKQDQLNESPNSENLFIRPSGLYVTVRFKGTYCQNNQFISIKFNDFIKKNDLEPAGNAYVMPLKNHWMTADTTEYINQISMQVKRKS